MNTTDIKVNHWPQWVNFRSPAKYTYRHPQGTTFESLCSQCSSDHQYRVHELMGQVGCCKLIVRCNNCGFKSHLHRMAVGPLVSMKK